MLGDGHDYSQTMIKTSTHLRMLILKRDKPSKIVIYEARKIQVNYMIATWLLLFNSNFKLWMGRVNWIYIY